ncbi:MAG: dTDP-4-dehydrorhamnose reductase [Actinomycetota bacterium]|nr:dTDP-4-dehydrorhamnose reductase [Actinomycetota bacterium]
MPQSVANRGVAVRVMVTGGEGQLGRDLRSVLGGQAPTGGDPGSDVMRALGMPPAAAEVLSTDVVVGTGIRLDITDREQVDEVVDGFRPELVIHAGACTAVDTCETTPDLAFAVNALGSRHVAEASARVGAHLVYLSTDYVFDGTLDRSYTEWDAPGPVSVYGLSKLGGELEVQTIMGRSATVVRTAWVNGVNGSNMAKTVLGLARRDPSVPLRFVDDQLGSPTFTADLAPAVVRLGLDRRPGVFHVTNQGETTWFGFARAVLELAGMDPDRVGPITTAQLDPPRLAPRPANSRLENLAMKLSGMPLLPGWRDGLARLVAVLDHSG